MRRHFVIWLAMALAMLAEPQALARTLDDVRSSGVVTCGLDPNRPGFSTLGKDYVWKGFDVDLCRALAAAVLGDANKVNLTSLSPEERFVALQSGEIDVLLHGDILQLGQETVEGLIFVIPTIYVGLSQLLPANIQKPEHLCTTPSLSGHTKPTAGVAEIPTTEELLASLASGSCDAVFGQEVSLMVLQAQVPSPATIQIEAFGIVALGPLVRQGDDQWFNIVRWTILTLLQAETSMPTAGEAFSLNQDWQLHVKQQVGDYATIFEKNLGTNSPIKMQRGRNNASTNGGLHFVPP